MSITITSDDGDINAKAEMLRIKAELHIRGVRTFPMAEMSALCPYKKPLQITRWMDRAKNVWYLRGSDNKILKAFEKTIVALDNELEVTEPEEVKGE